MRAQLNQMAAESDQFIPKEQEEVFVPAQVVRNFNQLVQEPQPVYLSSIGQLLETPLRLRDKQFSLTGKMTDKPNGQPLIRKQLSPDIIEEKKEKNAAISDDQSDAKSARSGRSAEIRQQKMKRLNSRVKQARRSVQLQSQSQLQTQIYYLVESIPFSILMAIVTLYALFGDDIRILTVTKKGDDGFFVMTIICMICFTLEIVLTCICKKEYICNFYFWLDVISTVTMILDIGWITDTWYGGDVTNASQIRSISTASRAARKAARVIRVIRLVRLVKLYKHARQQVEKQQQRRMLRQLLRNAQNSSAQGQEQPQQISSDPHQSQAQQTQPQQQQQGQHLQPQNQNQRIQPHSSAMQSQNDSQNDSQPEIVRNNSEDAGVHNSQHSPGKQLSNMGSSNIAQIEQGKESQVGSKLSDLVMRRVITIILAILISIPLLTLETFQEAINSYDSGLYRVSQFKDSQLLNILLEQYVVFHSKEIYQVHYINLVDKNTKYNYSSHPQWFVEPKYQEDEYRFSDQEYYLATQGDKLIVYASVDVIENNQINAALSISQTIFVCLVLAFSAIMFSKDVSDLVIDPIESMIKKIEMIANNPLEAVNIEEQEDLVLQELERQQDHAKLKQKEEEKHFETYILQKLIMKVGALLAVGFGEAGSEIIAENIKKGGSVDPMIPGKKVLAIFGFCDIRNFTDATEVLQQGVMLFVNEVAEIVHSCVDAYGGSANKNIGDAFLLVWKFAPDDYYPDPANPKNLKLRDEPAVHQKCDMAVIGFLKVITSVAISKKLEQYKHHEGLQARLKDFSVKMGFGLHMGWGIEGAIGSNFKIDASYLSPNVNMASRLEAATKQFGSLFLISGVLKKHLTPECQAEMRMIDIVTVKGSIEPVELHTVDMSVKNLLAKIKEPIDKFDVSGMNPRDSKKFRVVKRFQRDKLKSEALSGKVRVAEIFKTDNEIMIAREPYTQPFYEQWRVGFDHYIKGKWQDAAQVFSKTLTMIPDHKDGPSNTLLEVIHSYGGKAPSDWKGYRELTEK